VPGRRIVEKSLHRTHQQALQSRLGGGIKRLKMSGGEKVVDVGQKKDGTIAMDDAGANSPTAQKV
jgi:hypothetical protein